MKATMGRRGIPALRAAAWIASQEWSGRAQFERRGDAMVISGTDNYAYVDVRVDATFEGWDDGAAVTIGDDNPGMRRISRYCKEIRDWDMCKKLALVVEHDPASPALALEVTDLGDVPSTMRIAVTGRARRIHAEAFDEMPEGQNEGHMAVTSATWRKIGKLTNMLGLPFQAWEFHDRGPLHAFDLTCEERSARIIAMPTRGGE